ncbi:zinc-binding protein A33 [Tachysurus vachellii]|uniref:zinc-binding protein A33 n=1 Tax=Tachysurus vachellii TaxID=175792 RepID=UPI00296AB1E3|nr:zinc-binding protein A33 [Tachysurus vachellii]
MCYSSLSALPEHSKAAQRSFPKPAERGELALSLQTRVPKVTTQHVGCQYDRSVSGVTMSSKLPEEDLTCPVCCDIFTDPVLLSCSHSFCRSCLQNFWETSVSRSCPICRRKASRKEPPSNLALRNLCEAFVETQNWRCENEKKAACPQHGEKLKLFCIDDQQPICVVCQASRMHKGHECAPTDEAALDCKEQLVSALKTLKDKLDVVMKLKITSAMTLEHIQSQAQLIETQMKHQFMMLHRFLREEEEARLAALKEEETKKVLAVKRRDEELTNRISSLSDIINRTEQEIVAGDLKLLQNFRSAMMRTRSSAPNPEGFYGALIDEAEHLSNLKFRVWEKMQEVAPYCPVTLDPNTVHPCLRLSEDLSGVHYSSSGRPLPTNPERFCVSAEVLGSTDICSGTHAWEVELGESDDWILGVASVSVKRDLEVPARPENGFWTLCMRDGEYRAMESPVKTLKVDKKLERVRVEVDWDTGEVCFSCPDDGQILHRFKQVFKDKVVPYFYTQSEKPLRILPQLVMISVKNN